MEEQELCSETETDLLTASCTGGKATDGTIRDQSHSLACGAVVSSALVRLEQCVCSG